MATTRAALAARSPSQPRPAPGPTLVIGLGNPVLGDDAVGWRVVEALADRLADRRAAGRPVPTVEIDRLALGGLRLMERLVGYERAVVVDAQASGKQPGTVEVRNLDELAGPAPTHLGSSHDTSLATALAIGRALGTSLPDPVVVLTVEAGPVDEFSERLSAPVAAAVAPAAQRLLDVLLTKRWPCTSTD